MTLAKSLGVTTSEMPKVSLHEIATHLEVDLSKLSHNEVEKLQHLVTTAVIVRDKMSALGANKRGTSEDLLIKTWARCLVRIRRLIDRPGVWAHGSHGQLAKCPRLIVLPCTKLRVTLSLLFGNRIMNRVFDQLIGDIQSEWAEHFNAGRVWSARFVQYRGYAQVLHAVLAQAIFSTFKALAGVWKATIGGLRRGLRRSAGLGRRREQGSR